MEDILIKHFTLNNVIQDRNTESPKLKIESEIKITSFLKKSENKGYCNEPQVDLDNSISFKKFDKVFQERGEYDMNQFAGFYFEGIQYFDFKDVYFINNTGIANLIDLLKTLLKQGVVIKFVNVREKIRNKFNSMGLEFIFNCS